MKSYGELPEYAKINENVAFPGDDEDDDNIIEFGEVSGDESEIDDVSILEASGRGQFFEIDKLIYCLFITTHRSRLLINK